MKKTIREEGSRFETLPLARELESSVFFG